ncbi:MAG: hypothetical protein JRF33_00645 [Deltaproteobacteria bacterium]|nr:hypothetical protein [Deltaproteobacteria bacterium]
MGRNIGKCLVVLEALFCRASYAAPFCAVLVLSLPVSVWAADLRLQSLVATSGDGAERLLDGDAKTGWAPVGQAMDEGVLFRFEKPTSLDSIQIEACPDAGTLYLLTYLNGIQWAPERSGNHVFLVKLPTRRRMLRSLFIRIEGANGKACLGEVRFFSGEQELKVLPPRAVAGKVSASSTLAPVDAYHSAYLFDGRTDFGWVEGAKGLGVGESVTLELEAPIKLQALELWNGYQRSKDHFRKNARATALGLKVDGGVEIPLKVKDRRGAQKLRLPKAVEGKRFELIIRKAVRGKRYPDLVLSELRLWDEQGALTVRSPAMAERQKVLEQAIAGKTLASLVNRVWISRCGDRRNARLKLRSNHTFVWYESMGDDKDAVDAGERSTEVFDGAWVPTRAPVTAAAIKLYGRRHRSSAEWDPYAGNQSKKSVRIGGGKVNLRPVAKMSRSEFSGLLRKWKKSPAANRVDCLQSMGEGRDAIYKQLKVEGAIFVQGRSMTDLMVPLK